MKFGWQNPIQSLPGYQEAEQRRNQIMSTSAPTMPRQPMQSYAVPNESLRVPGVSQDVIDRIDADIDTMQESEDFKRTYRHQIYQDAVVEQQNVLFRQERNKVKNSLLQRIPLEKDETERNRMQSLVKISNLADFVRDGARKNGYVYDTRDDQKLIEEYIAHNPNRKDTFNSYLSGNISDVDVGIDMGLIEKPKSVQDAKYNEQHNTLDVLQGEDKGERNDELLPYANPIFKKDEDDSFIEGAGKTIANVLPSAWNVIAGLGNMALNPLDTARSVGEGFVGGAVNAGTWLGSKIMGDTPEEREEKRESILTTLEEKTGINLKDDSEIAGAIADFMIQRYGDWDSIKKTVVEDPVGVVGDFVGVLEGGVGVASKVGVINNAQKISMMNKLSKIQPYTQIPKGIVEGTKYTAKGVANIPKNIGKLTDAIVGLDKKTKKGIQNNPYVKEMREKSNQRIEENGMPTKPQEVSKDLIGQLQGEVSETFLGLLDQFDETGPMYKKLKETKASIEVAPIRSKIGDIIKNNGIKVNEKGILNFSKTAISETESKAIQRLHDRVKTTDTMDVSEHMRFRKSIDELGLRENKKGSTGNRIIKQIRDVANKNAHKQVSALKDLDDLYSTQAKAYQEFSEGLVYRDKRRFGEWRDNLNSILKNLDTPNRKQMKDRIEKIMPGIEQKVEAINLMPKLIENYYSTNKQGSKAQDILYAGVMGMLGASGGVKGAIAGSTLGWAVSRGFDKVKVNKRNRAIGSLSEEGKIKLMEIEKKIQSNQSLSVEQSRMVDEIGRKIEQMNEDLPDGPQGKGNIEWSKGKIDTSKYQIVSNKVKTNNFKKWFGDWERDPRGKDVSKVLDGNMKPLIVYHGTNSKFTEFLQKDPGGGFPDASYFTNHRGTAKTYGDTIMKVYLDIKKPVRLDVNGRTFNDAYYEIMDAMKQAKSEGNDGLIIKNIKDDFLQKGGGKKGDTYVVFSPEQIKSATDNIGTFDTNNPDIRFQKNKADQKYGVAKNESTISAEQSKKIANIRNGKTVEELAKHYGIDVKVVDKITTPEGAKAYGKYNDGIITLSDKLAESTAPHELLHATFDLVDNGRKESILKGIMKDKKIDKFQAEEFLADSFSEYFRTGKMPWQGLSNSMLHTIKKFYQQIKDFITGVGKNKKQIKKLFDEILDGELDRDMLGEILGNKKGTDTHRHQQSGPRLVSVPVKSSISITPENASIFRSKLSKLSNKVVKNGNFGAGDFLDSLKTNLNLDKKSGYLISQKDSGIATLRISDHYANARNNKIRGYIDNNTSIVIKLGDGKFKGKKGVDLIEYVYDPKNLTSKKMQGIVKGVQDWIDTGNYTDKGYDHTHQSMRATLENGEVKYQRVLK